LSFLSCCSRGRLARHYMAASFAERERSSLGFFGPVEKLIHRLCRIDETGRCRPSPMCCASCLHAGGMFRALPDPTAAGGSPAEPTRPARGALGQTADITRPFSFSTNTNWQAYGRARPRMSVLDSACSASPVHETFLRRRRHGRSDRPWCEASPAGTSATTRQLLVDLVRSVVLHAVFFPRNSSSLRIPGIPGGRPDAARPPGRRPTRF